MVSFYIFRSISFVYLLGGFNETELLKIWKGLHYCMWMQDKPLIQEELSDNIANLIHSFNNAHTAMLFITTFYKTECREWTSIDKWRMDKFLMVGVVKLSYEDILFNVIVCSEFETTCNISSKIFLL